MTFFGHLYKHWIYRSDFIGIILLLHFLLNPEEFHNIMIIRYLYLKNQNKKKKKNILIVWSNLVYIKILFLYQSKSWSCYQKLLVSNINRETFEDATTVNKTIYWIQVLLHSNAGCSSRSPEASRWKVIVQR